MHRPLGILVLACSATPGLTLGMAARAEVAGGTGGEAGAIRTAAADYMAAVRRGDADALRKMWTESGDYVDATGQVYKAHDLIRPQAATPQPNEQSAAVPPESSLRFITPAVAIEDGTFECGNAGDGSVLTGRFTAVWVKRDGRWLLDGLREATTTSLPLNKQLRQLEWLLGEWVGTTDDSVMLVSSRLSEGGNYIVREFVIRGTGGETTGTERIGWDPIAQGFRSWTFDSQDGRGEGRWRQDSNRWLMENTEVMPDGKEASTSAVFTPKNDGHFLWEVKSAKVGKVHLPSQRVEFKRAPEIE